MMQLDVGSVAISCSLLATLVALILFAARRSYEPDIHASLTIWATALLFVVISSAPFVWALPASLPVIVIGNLSLVVGYTGFAMALRRFMARPLPLAVYALPLLAVVVGTIFFSTIVPSYSLRVAVVIVFLLALQATLVRPIFHSLRRGGEVGQRVVALSFLASIVALVARLAWEWRPAAPSLAWLAGIDVVGMHMLLIWMTPVVASIGFLLMCNERLMRATRHLAETDALTGIYGRRAILEQSEFALTSARGNGLPISVLMIDADHFKLVNDHHGHEAGDAVLVELVRRLRNALRSHDVIGRVGGEEFLALLPGTDGRSALEIAERLLNAVRVTPIDHDVLSVSMTLSIGVAAFDGQDANLDALIRRADAALYAAKDAGRDRAVLAP
jgi:diguanylate cyclase (GGDEF)-like protein